jgi:uncharacterized membrane protein YkvA (DUF1232 family)
MADQLGLFPPGLARAQLARLSELAETASALQVGDLQRYAGEHLDQARAAHAQNRFVNVRLAEAICRTVDRVAGHWDALQPNVRNWLGGAILYFATCNDDEPDFTSAIGFEDDVEVLNACLRLARLDELCLNPGDYDDA